LPAVIGKRLVHPPQACLELADKIIVVGSKLHLPVVRGLSSVLPPLLLFPYRSMNSLEYFGHAALIFQDQ